jgi:hypothetical protein
VTSDDAGLSLQDGMSRTGIAVQELWLRQLAQALNEWCLARGGDHPVAYWRSGAIR